jgi:inosine-uridine nucleoside N-ribohydrolase
MIRYHIDTDMGVDDGLALVVASRLLNSALSAVSTVFGNVPVQVATRNATIFRRLIRPDHKFAIMSGAERASDGHFRDARHVHGDDGLGGATADLGSSFLHQIDARSEVSRLSAVALSRRQTKKPSS